jgi:hypothetical protein
MFSKDMRVKIVFPSGWSTSWTKLAQERVVCAWLLLRERFSKLEFDFAEILTR